MLSFLSAAILIVCSLIIWKQLRLGWSSWIGVALVIVALRTALDTVISPWIVQRLDIRFLITGNAAPDEILPSMSLILLTNVSVAIGLLIVHRFTRYRDDSPHFREIEYPLNLSNQAWKASILIAVFGGMMNIAVFVYLFQGGYTLEGIAQRAAFTYEGALASPFYNYARLLSRSMLVGALGMLLFSRRLPHRLRLAFIVLGIYVLFQAMLGGRSQVILSMVAVALGYHLGVHRLRLKQALMVGSLALIGIIYVYVFRLGISAIWDVPLSFVQDALTRPRLDQVAFMLRNVPENLPHAGFGPLLAGLSHAMPGVPLPGAQNTWNILQEYLYGRDIIPGVGGTNYAAASELYLAFGIPGNVLIGVFYGVIFGLFFNWARKQYDNPFVLLFSVLLVLRFFNGLESKIAYSLGGVMLSEFVPVIALTTLALLHRRDSQTVFLFIYAGGTGLLAYQWIQHVTLPLPFAGIWVSLVKYGTLTLLAIAAALGAKLLQRAGRPYGRAQRATTA